MVRIYIICLCKLSNLYFVLFVFSGMFLEEQSDKKLWKQCEEETCSIEVHFESEDKNAKALLTRVNFPLDSKVNIEHSHE